MAETVGAATRGGKRKESEEPTTKTGEGSTEGDKPNDTEGNQAEPQIDIETTKFPLRNIKDKGTGNTPVMYAVMENKSQMIERMLDLGCDLSTCNKEGYNSLHMACMYAREDTVKLVLFRGQLARKSSSVSPNQPNRQQPIDIGALGGVKQQSYLHLVCGRKSSQALNVLKELLRFNVGSKSRLAPDQDKNIPLFVAIEAGNFAICKELLSHHAEEQLKYTKVANLSFE